jgi:exopolyphosphatase/guanosine-5'-triphosphate,3'-diphosphate pyrophosphatase
MRLAVIDLGTNSIRFDVHEISSNRKGLVQHRRLYREKTMVRLGQDLFLAGKLSNEGKRRTLEAVYSFKETMDALDVDKIVAFGTAAVRDASDGDTFLKEIETKTGVHFRMITGAEEASLIAKGILHFDKTPPGVYALVDIGGGSTEISICKGTKILRSHSFNLGVAKLQQVFLKTQPPKKIQISKKKKSDPVQDLRNFIKSVVLPKMLIDRWPKAARIIGSSGSVIALAKLVHTNREAASLPFTRKALSKTVKVIENKTPVELLSIQGMEPKRVDLILAGGILLDEVALLLGAKQIRTSEFALRDGILVDELEHYHKTSSKSASFPLEEVQKRINTWGIDHKHAQTVREHAEWMFDELKTVHGLKPAWKNYLSAAALLHDSGELISHSNHAEHSEYIIKNAHFVGMHEWESTLIALLGRYHKEEKMAEKMGKIPYPKKDELRTVFLKLLSILQLADAIDRTHKHSLQLKRKKIARGKVELYFKSKHPCDLEMLRFEQKKNLFELVFKREISISRIK